MMVNLGGKRIIWISTTGNWIRGFSRREMPLDKKGYTLIELMVVIVLLGLIFTIATPKIRDALFRDELKGATRQMVGLITRLRNEAIREHKDYMLHFDLESNRFWFDSPTMTEEERARIAADASPLMGQVDIMDVWISGEGKIMLGEVRIRINKKGYIQQSIIHLGMEDNREFTLLLSPFLRRVEVYDEYIEFEDI
jgi:prepilin-type N-terminal cleavage/methylation domain-containing protein